MPRLQTKYFGELEYHLDTIFHFPAGIPGFEDQREFTFLKQPGTHPLVFMQSVSNPELCFLTVSALVANPQFRPEWRPEDCEALNLPSSNLEIGKNVYCLAIITIQEGADPTCNLASPIVLNPLNRRGVQSLLNCAEDSLHYPLLRRKEASAC